MAKANEVCAVAKLIKDGLGVIAEYQLYELSRTVIYALHLESAEAD